MNVFIVTHEKNLEYKVLPSSLCSDKGDTRIRVNRTRILPLWHWSNNLINYGFFLVFAGFLLLDCSETTGHRNIYLLGRLNAAGFFLSYNIVLMKFYCSPSAFLPMAFGPPNNNPTLSIRTFSCYSLSFQHVNGIV